MTIHNKNNNIIYLFLIFLFTIVILSPQIFLGNMILGSDSIFHFNRFYDTAQQIKNLNFSYHISIYGFQQSARIVNALYSPFIAYFQGILVLISKNWFIYQIVSNLVLFNIAGISMYIFLLKGKLQSKLAFLGAILYVSSYAIQYWIIRQGFTSWGASLLPLSLSILFELNETKQVPRFLLGIYTALIVQTHMLSSLLLVLVYVPFFVLAFFQSKHKFIFIKQLLTEIGIFLGLTMNIWASYFSLLKNNQIINPRINLTMSLNTIDQNSYYWLMNPVTLIPIFLVIYFFFFKNWKKLDVTMKSWFWIMNIFLLLTTSIIPWDDLIEKHNPVAELIQYPFRFFVPVTIVAIYLVLKIFSSYENVRKIFIMTFIISIIQPIILITVSSLDWDSADHFMLNQHKVVFASDSETIKNSFFDTDKKKSLELVSKGTPDYLPSYGEISKKSDIFYNLYISKIIRNQDFNKKYTKDGLTIEWQGESAHYIELPIVVYKNTILRFNGKQLDNNSLSLSEIGTPTLRSQPNTINKVTISYRTGTVEKVMIVFSLFAWVVVFVMVLCKFRPRRYLMLRTNSI